jgi:hypothetical protein
VTRALRQKKPAGNGWDALSRVRFATVARATTAAYFEVGPMRAIELQTANLEEV